MPPAEDPSIGTGRSVGPTPGVPYDGSLPSLSILGEHGAGDSAAALGRDADPASRVAPIKRLKNGSKTRSWL